MNNEGGYETPPSSDEDEMEVSDDDNGAIGADFQGGQIYQQDDEQAYQSPPVARWQPPLVPGAPLRQQQLPPWGTLIRQPFPLFPPQPPPVLYASPSRPSSGYESKISPPQLPQLPRAVAGRGLVLRLNNNEDEVEDAEEDAEEEDAEEEDEEEDEELPGTPPSPERRRRLGFGRRRRSRRREAASVEKYLNMYW